LLSLNIGEGQYNKFPKNPRSSFSATRRFVTYNERGDAGITYFKKEIPTILEIEVWLFLGNHLISQSLWKDQPNYFKSHWWLIFLI
jgi:hypothetical protein